LRAFGFKLIKTRSEKDEWFLQRLKTLNQNLFGITNLPKNLKKKGQLRIKLKVHTVLRFVILFKPMIKVESYFQPVK